jgi:hypothetical protein
LIRAEFGYHQHQSDECNTVLWHLFNLERVHVSSLEIANGADNRRRLNAVFRTDGRDGGIDFMFLRPAVPAGMPLIFCD